MKKKSVVVLIAIFCCLTAFAQRQMEYLNRGVVAVPDGKGNIFISWRLLVTDDDKAGFNVYRISSGKPTKLNATPITAYTHYADEKADSNKTYTYFVTTIVNGKEQPASEKFTVSALAKPYLSIPLRTPEGYSANDASVGDLDGDGRPDVVFANAYDNTISIYRNIVPVVVPPVADATATVPLVISANNSNATVVLNGSLSSDPNGRPLQYTWYQTGSPNPLATGVIAVVVLPVGTNSITLMVSDGLASSGQTITVAVITLAQAVDQLEAVVNADVAKQQSLAAILNAALGSIDRSNPTAAINQLQAFQNQVSAQISPLNSALANTLIDEAQNIINTLSAGGAASHKALKAAAQANGKLHLNFSGIHQQTYIIEASTNLVDWQMIGVANDNGDGTFDFDDAVSTQIPARYYRVVIP